MKTIHSVVSLCLGLLLPAEGFALNASPKLARVPQPSTCESLMKGDFSLGACRERVEKDDRLKKHWPSVAKIKETDTSELCQSASNASQINNNRCEQAVDELKKLLNERQQAALDRCDDKLDQFKACQACSTNIGAASCQEQNMAMNKQFMQRSQIGMAKRKQLMDAARNVENEMFQLSEDYGKNLSDLKQDMAQKKKVSTAAKNIGAGSISEGLSKHGNAHAADIYRAVDQLRNKREVTQSDLQTAENVRSQYARESLLRALEAKAARLEMEKENQQDSRGIAELDRNTSKVARNTSNLNSVDPAASQGAVSGSPETESQLNPGSAGGAASGAAGALGSMAGAAGRGSGDSQADAGGIGDSHPAQTAAQAANPQRLEGLVNKPEGAKSVGIQDLAADGAAANQTGVNNSTGSSRSPARDSLRARLAERLAEGKAGGTDPSQAAAAGGSGGLAAKLREKAGAHPDMLTGFSPAAFSVAGGDNFSMPQSETDAAVKEMMRELEGTASSEAGLGIGGRFLASVAGHGSSPEILAADSSDLFLRTKIYYERCQKRGCVTK